MASHLPSPDDVLKMAIVLSRGAGAPSSARSYGAVFGRALLSQMGESSLSPVDPAIAMDVIDLKLTLGQVRDSDDELLAEFGNGALLVLRRPVERAADGRGRSSITLDGWRMGQDAQSMSACGQAMRVENAHILAESRFRHARQMARSRSALEHSRALLARVDRGAASSEVEAS